MLVSREAKHTSSGMVAAARDSQAAREVEIKLEFDPAVMNRERLDVLAAHRFDQLSFGIETLDPEINARHNRGRQGIELIERSFADLKAVGMDDVACDFLLGLEGTTPAGMLGEMETVLRRFQPNWVDIFMLTPTNAYLDSHFGGSWDAFWAHIRPFEETIPPALPALAARTGESYELGDTTAFDAGYRSAEFMPCRLRTQLLKVHARCYRRGLDGRWFCQLARRVEGGQCHRH